MALVCDRILMTGFQNHSTIITTHMKNIIIGIVATMAILGGIIWLTRPDKSEADINYGTSSLQTAEGEYDFGTISMAKGKVSKIFAVKNASAQAAFIEKIYTSCMCTEASLIKSDRKLGPFGMPGHGLVPKVNQTLNPGEETQVEVVFDPNAHGPAGVGAIERIVYVEEKERLPLELKIKAMVTP